MRELKFRAWKMFNGKLRRYVCSPFGLLDYAQRHPEAPVLHHEDVNDIRDFMPNVDVIEQYTGLKDKNGKEIYEGDIIRCHGDDRFIAPVIRHDNSGGFCWVSCYKEECFIPESDEVEVIGNIHDAPELLEDK